MFIFGLILFGALLFFAGHWIATKNYSWFTLCGCVAFFVFLGLLKFQAGYL